MEATTVKVRRGTAEILERMKVHPRQPYEEVIQLMLSKKIQKKAAIKAKGKITTIKLRKKTARLLEKMKVHPRQPYEEVILGLVQK